MAAAVAAVVVATVTIIITVVVAAVDIFRKLHRNYVCYPNCVPVFAANAAIGPLLGHGLRLHHHRRMTTRQMSALTDDAGDDVTMDGCGVSVYRGHYCPLVVVAIGGVDVMLDLNCT